LARILVVEDHPTLRKGIARVFRDKGHAVDEAGDGEEALSLLRGGQPYAAVVSDLKLPKAGGMEVLRAARLRDPGTAVIIMTAFGSIENAIEAMKLGAVDYVQKPFEIAEIESRVEKALAEGEGPQGGAAGAPGRRQGGGKPRPVPEIIGDGPAMREVLQTVRLVAPAPSSVLITGETGTGKELVARALHRGSPRAGREFVMVNCAAIPETLLEAELFGHEKGAFTGAVAQRAGRFEQADGGSIFLDEIGDMSPLTQSKILRVLQEREFERLGGNRTVKVDVRVITATHRDLAGEILRGGFREDLFYRLNVLHIHLPPLRERREDIIPLARHFIDQFREELGSRVGGLTPGAEERLRDYPWPGNVRELRNTLERAVLMAPGELLDAGDLELSRRAAPPGGGGGESGGAGPSTLKEVEKEALLDALRRADFVQKEAAKLLGITQRVMHYKIEQFGITHPRWRKNK
jgi:two-component system, NtrC family, response regulator HydG